MWWRQVLVLVVLLKSTLVLGQGPVFEDSTLLNWFTNTMRDQRDINNNTALSARVLPALDLRTSIFVGENYTMTRANLISDWLQVGVRRLNVQAYWQPNESGTTGTFSLCPYPLTSAIYCPKLLPVSVVFDLTQAWIAATNLETQDVIVVVLNVAVYPLEHVTNSTQNNTRNDTSTFSQTSSTTLASTATLSTTATAFSTTTFSATAFSATAFSTSSITPVPIATSTFNLTPTPTPTLQGTSSPTASTEQNRRRRDFETSTNQATSTDQASSSLVIVSFPSATETVWSTTPLYLFNQTDITPTPTPTISTSTLISTISASIPTPTTPTSTLTSTISTSTLTPTESTSTLTPIESTSTPTPTVSTSTLASTISTSTPTPTVSTSTLTPTPTASPTPNSFPQNVGAISAMLSNYTSYLLTPPMSASLNTVSGSIWPSLQTLLQTNAKLIVGFGWTINYNASRDLNWMFTALELNGLVNSFILPQLTCPVSVNTTFINSTHIVPIPSQALSTSFILTAEGLVNPVTNLLELYLPFNVSSATDAVTCGYSPLFFHVVEQDVFQTLAWSWLALQPMDDDDTKNCAGMRVSDGRWEALDCTTTLPLACLNTATSQWVNPSTISAVAWASALQSCPSGSVFTLPKSPTLNNALFNEANPSSYDHVWIDFSDSGVEGCWVQHTETCPYAQSQPGLTPAQRTAIITVSVVGGIVVLVLGVIFSIYKYNDTIQYFRKRKFDLERKVRRKVKFEALPA